jgi:hypothetical protein
VNKLSKGMGALAVTAALTAIVPTAVAAPASAEPPTIITQVNHVEFSDHFDADPNCGTEGSTEFFDGTDRLQSVVEGDTVHVAFGSTFKILEVSDDPSVPVRERQATDAATFQLVNNGAVQIFHESFHDKNTVWGDIALYVTFVAVNGQVQVDHFFARNLPPDGC